MGILSMRGTSILVGLIIVLPGGRMGFPSAVSNRSAESSSGETQVDYLKWRISAPIEMVFWRTDFHGHPHVPSGAFVTAWAKFGEFLGRLIASL